MDKEFLTQWFGAGGKVWTSKINGNTTIPDGDVPYNRYWTDK